jgi:CubicO group peptidase (beta-lactamase class C family)
MHTFPPPEAGQVTLANWRTGPFNRWAFHHVRELVPSADIPNDPRNVWELPVALRELSAGDLQATETDGLVILHRGKIVFEYYASGMTAESPHILMSVTKSLLGILAGILAARGMLEPERPVIEVIPELRDTAYRGATIRHLLDMATGIDFDENYLATSGPIVEYRKSTGWNPLAPGETASDLRSFLHTLKKSDGRHGGRFHYVSPNSDLLGWVIERSAGRRYADLMSALLWRPMGAECSAYITVDRLGAPRCAGGMCVTTRDLARVGQLLVQDGTRDGRQVIPREWIADVMANGDPRAWDAGPFAVYYPRQSIHYRSKCYVLRGEQPLFFGLGIHGQNVFVDRARELVIAKVSSQPQPMDPRRIALTTKLVEEIRKVFV